MSSTSLIEDGLPVTGLTISVGTAGSPDTLNIIANATDYAQSMKSTIVMTTNVGDSYVRRHPTIVDPGEPAFTIFWIPEEPSHRNSADSGTVTAGLRYLMIQKLLRQVVVHYPPDSNGNNPSDSFMSYFTEFGITGKTADVFRASVKLGISDQNPSFC